MSDRVLSMNLATLRNGTGFGEMVEDCLRYDVTAISPWRDQIEAVGLKEAIRIVEANELRVTGLCRGGMFPSSSAEGRQKSIEDNLRAIDEAAALGADCLVLVVGGLPEGSRDLAGARHDAPRRPGDRSPGRARVRDVPPGGRPADAGHRTREL